jgi:hypothetical protein
MAGGGPATLADMPPTKISVHAIVTEPGFVTEAQVASMLANANPIYASANVTFELSSFEVDADPALAKDPGPSERGGPPYYRELAREARAAQYPGQVWHSVWRGQAWSAWQVDVGAGTFQC